MNNRNVNSNTIMIDVDALQRSNIAKLKSLNNNKKKTNDIIKLLTKTFTLKKRKE